MSFQVGIGSLGKTVFFQVEICTPLWTMGVKGKKWPKMTKQNCLTMYLRNCTSYDCGFLYTCAKCHRVYFKIFCVMGHNILTKFALVSFPQKSSFNTIVQFGHSLGQNHTILCRGQLCLLIHSLEVWNMVWWGCNSYTNVAVNLPKKFAFWVRATLAKFGPILCSLMSHDSLSEDLFEILWHDKAQYRWLKVTLVIFPKFRNILLWCSVIVRRKSH